MTSGKLPPGHYVVALDPDGELDLGLGVRARLLEGRPEPQPLAGAIAAWFSSPINEHGTPYVSHPLDFTPDEQAAFVDLVREPRLVTRDEQIAKLREIVAARTEK